MVKIKHERLAQFVGEHVAALRGKLEDFPSDCPYLLDEVLSAPPEKLAEIAEWFGELSESEKNRYSFMVKKYENFATKKQECDAYDLAEKLDVNVCPYCNINPTYTIRKNHTLRPEFDHFYNKATYPILALSFFNLIPSCHVCNSTLKGSKSIQINPYQESLDRLATFELSIKDSSFYYDAKGFEIELTAEDERAEDSIETFKLNDRYEKHKDIILELIQKNAIYNESYLDELFSQYEGTIFRNREDLLRMISGGYMDEEEINKRPLSKLIKDISAELGLT